MALVQMGYEFKSIDREFMSVYSDLYTTDDKKTVLYSSKA